MILYFKNAGTESDWDPRRWLVQKSLRIDEATTVNKVPSNEIKFDIETTNRASWRAFAEKYSFVAILPFLVAAVTFWFTGYANRRRVQNRQAARERLEAYKTALKNAENEKVVSAAWIELRRLRSYLPDDDLGRAELLHRVSTGDFPAGLELEFNTWSDAWVGTLILAGEALTQQSSQHKTHPAHTARNNEASAGIESTQSSKLADLYRCIRIFPVDLASPEAERRLRKLREELGLPAPQSHDWPPLAEPPDDYPLDTEGTPATIGTLKLFPRETGNAFDEIGYLFSEKEWYWREHPLYVKLRTCLQPVLVYGDVGSGRTALALALTQHAEHEDKVLGSYHKGAVSLAEAQVSLGQELLRFIGKRSTRLSNLTRDDRDLLASVLLSVLSDDIQVLSALSSVDPAQFIVISEDDKAKLPLLQEQAKVEFRLLSDSVKRMKGKPPLLGQQWFYALSRCAAKLRFVRVRIALDLTAEDFHRWRGEHLGQFRAGLPADLNFPFQLIVLVPGSITDFDGARHGFVPEQLQWVARSDNGITYLMKMLHYRYERRVGGNESPIQPGAQNALCSAAQHNPRRLARLWNRIASKYPERTQITSRMITHANAELERP